MKALAARLAMVIPTWIGITLVTFALIHVAPGDPAELRAGLSRGASPEAIAANRRLAGLDRPLFSRYLAWCARSARLDFGASLTDGRAVRDKILEALPATATLALTAALLAFGVAVPLGVWAARRDGSAAAALLEVALAVAYGLPQVALALLLLRAGAPYGGGGLRVIAPAFCLALPSLATLSRHQRAALLEALSADYVRTARAKGARERTVAWVHGLPNALGPLVTLLGSQVPVLLSGSVLIEEIFGIRGLGSLGFDAVIARDYPVLMGLATLGALVTLLGVLGSDLIASWIDPRLARASAGPAVPSARRP